MLTISNNTELDEINSGLDNLPNLETICIDDINSNHAIDIISSVDFPVTLTEYCNLELVLSNQIIGNIRFDMNNNGCDNLELK